MGGGRKDRGQGGWGAYPAGTFLKIEVLGNRISHILSSSQCVLMSHFFLTYRFDRTNIEPPQMYVKTNVCSSVKSVRH